MTFKSCHNFSKSSLKQPDNKFHKHHRNDVRTQKIIWKLGALKKCTVHKNKAARNNVVVYVFTCLWAPSECRVHYGNTGYGVWSLGIQNCKYFWPLARRSGPRNSFVRRLSCPICSNLRHFQCISSCMHFKTSLDMFKNRIKSHHKHYDMSGHVWESYQIASQALWHVWSFRSICERSWTQFFWVLFFNKLIPFFSLWGVFLASSGLHEVKGQKKLCPC